MWAGLWIVIDKFLETGFIGEPRKIVYVSLELIKKV